MCIYIQVYIYIYIYVHVYVTLFTKLTELSHEDELTSERNEILWCALARWAHPYKHIYEQTYIWTNKRNCSSYTYIYIHINFFVNVLCNFILFTGECCWLYLVRVLNLFLLFFVFCFLILVFCLLPLQQRNEL